MKGRLMLRRLWITGAVLVFVTLTGAALTSPRASPWGAGYLPNVPLVNQRGEPLRFYDDVIRGKIIVISFIYTSCRDICPVVTARLAQVQDKLGAAVGRDIFFVSISIDPTTDTPAKLKDYADVFGAGKGWTFLTGKTEDVNLIRFKLGERSRKLTEHGNTILLYNDHTGEWSRDSAFSDLNVLAANIRTMNPAWSSGRDVTTDGAAATSSDTVKDTSLAVDLPGQSLFVKTCAACHTIGRGDRVGPDLNGLAARRSRAWIVKYLMSPQTMRAQGDPAALELLAKYPTIRMPTLSLSEDDAADLMGYVEAMSYGAASDGKNVQVHQHDHGSHDHAAHGPHHD
jgi:protein SCO1/2